MARSGHESRVVENLRSQRVGLDDDAEARLYWPQEFAVALGRRAGFILPRDGRCRMG